MDANKLLFDAIASGDEARAISALADGAELTSKDDLGNTPLCAAASAGRGRLVELLLDRGADIAGRGYCDMTALTLAARDGHLDVVELLLARGAAKDERSLDDPLLVAQMSVHSTPQILAVLQRARLDVVAPAPAGMGDADARLITASESGDEAGAKAALEAGANPLARDDRGMDPLSWAALRGHDTIVRLLLDRGAKIDAPNGSGWPPIGQASGQGRLEVVKTLIARGANVNAIFDGRTALMCAAHQNHIDVVRALLDAGADRSVTHEGMTARDLARDQGNRAIAELLSDDGGTRAPKKGGAIAFPTKKRNGA